MSKKGDFLDPAQKHTLSEQECDLIAFFRTLSKSKRQVVLQTLFSVLLNGHAKRANRKEKGTDA